MVDEADRFYDRLKQKGTGGRLRRSSRRGRESSTDAETSAEPYGVGRDPRPIVQAMTGFAREYGWEAPLAQAEVLLHWPEICGEEVARHARADAIDAGTLVVRCDSTGWATQLRAIRAETITRIQERFPSAGIESIRYLGPDAPDWKHGPRTIPGRGPRDTYG